MAVETRTPPRSAQAGDTLAWVASVPDYPAPTWSLTYTIINASAKITVTTTPSGTDHAANVPAATTAAWTPGGYDWIATASNGTERHTVSRGSITITPDLAAQTSGYDARSAARRALDDLRAALAAWIASKGHIQSFSVDGVETTFASAADLQSRIALLEREVARENAAANIAAGLGSGRRVMVRF